MLENFNQNINIRVKELINRMKINQKKFGEITNIGQRNTSSLLLGKTFPSYTVLANVVSSIKELNARWLLTGEGAMWQSDDLSQSEGKFPNNALVSASEPVTNFQVRQIVQPSQAPEIEIYYLKELLRQQAETITALQKLVKELETPKE